MWLLTEALSVNALTVINVNVDVAPTPPMIVARREAVWLVAASAEALTPNKLTAAPPTILVEMKDAKPTTPKNAAVPATMAVITDAIPSPTSSADTLHR